MTTVTGDRRQRRQRVGDRGRADDLHEAGELPGADASTPPVKRRAAWSTCRSSSTSRARSAGAGRTCAMPRGPSSTRSTRRSDRLSLIFFGNGARVVDAMPAGRGFDKARVIADIPNTLPGGSTAMVQGLTADGTSCARCRPASSPACASSCSSPTARRTACRASTIPARRRVARPENLGLPGRTCADPDNQTHANPHDRRSLHTPDTGAATPQAVHATARRTAWHDRLLEHAD